MLALLLLSTAVAQWKTSPCDPLVSQGEPFCDTSLPIADRVSDLISRLTLTDKIHLLDSQSLAVKSVRLPHYEWWSEALHGIALSAGVRWEPPTTCATSFPQVICTAAAFNRTLWSAVAQTISTEGRAFANVEHAGLTFWAPNINIFRDPRWGRGQETPGEDPYTTSEYVALFVQGMQSGVDPNYLKVSACCKHFVAYSLEDWNGTTRHQFNAVVTQQDLEDTYLPAFQSCVQRGQASGMMCSYNELNGVPTCADYDLLTTKARQQWGFDGYITSDCGAVQDIEENHNYTNTTDQTISVVVNSGMDLDCGEYFLEYTNKAIDDGVIKESDLTPLLSHLFAVQMRLGMWDPYANQTYRSITTASINTKPSEQLALEAAQQGVILLKNDNSLPLSASSVKTLALIGPNGDMFHQMQGNYNGIPPYLITPHQGLSSYTKVNYTIGCSISGMGKELFAAALNNAETADVTVMLMGIDQTIEREGQDRVNISLPGVQDELIADVARVSKGPVILVIVAGGGVDISAAKANKRVNSILWVGYPGQSGGQAIADVIFGTYNPAGRLPMTIFPANYINQVSMFDMGMRPNASNGNPGRTYRFYTGTPVYKFGDGMGYTTFSYVWTTQTTTTFSFPHIQSMLEKHKLMDENTKLSRSLYGVDFHKKFALTDAVCNVTNTGTRPSDVVVIAYMIPANAGQNGNPISYVFGFERIFLLPGESKLVSFPITALDLSVVSVSGVRAAMTGSWTVALHDSPSQLHIDVVE